MTATPRGSGAAPTHSRLPPWVQQLGIVSLACLLAGGLIILGYWQLRVYHAQGQQAAAQRAGQPTVRLTEVAPAGSPVRDGYGRSVILTGHYLPDDQLLVPLAGSPDAFRVLTAFQLDGGLVVPVVRGVVRGGSPAAPPPPIGSAQQVGVLLPSEEASGVELAAGRLGSVRVPALAQLWPPLQTDGYVVLSAADAAGQGLEPAPLVLPEGSGRLRNGAYALQWWVFAAFAVGLGVRIARDVGRRDELGAEPLVNPR